MTRPRPRLSSVPVGAMVAALVVIGIVALVALYFGNSGTWINPFDPPVFDPGGPERGVSDQ